MRESIAAPPNHYGVSQFSLGDLMQMYGEGNLGQPDNWFSPDKITDKFAYHLGIIPWPHLASLKQNPKSGNPFKQLSSLDAFMAGYKSQRKLYIPGLNDTSLTDPNITDYIGTESFELGKEFAHKQAKIKTMVLVGGASIVYKMMDYISAL